jgi:hypothetical protein
MKYDPSNDIRSRIGKVPNRLQTWALIIISITIFILLLFQFFLSYDTTYSLQGYLEIQNNKGSQGIALIAVPAALLKESKLGKIIHVSVSSTDEKPLLVNIEYYIDSIDLVKSQLFIVPKDKNDLSKKVKWNEIFTLQITVPILIRKKIFG